VVPSLQPPNEYPVFAKPEDEGSVNVSVIWPVTLAGAVPVSAPFSVNESAYIAPVNCAVNVSLRAAIVKLDPAEYVFDPLDQPIKVLFAFVTAAARVCDDPKL
jgi:hypothetical protein